MKSLLAIFAATILITSGFFMPAVIAAPNDNASNTAKQNAQVKIPDHAVQIAPGIYHLGTAIHEGKIVEGIMAFHHRAGHDKGPGGSGSDSDEKNTCYSLLAKGAKWKSIENWIVNPANSEGLSDTFLLDNLSADIAKWETEAGTDIFGVGSLTNLPLVADSSSPDNQNEIYFADIDSPGAIGVTITWGIFSGPPSQRVLIEWDQVYDDVDFQWSNTGDPLKMDFENIATHEIGHAMGLSHPSETCAEETMYAFATEGETKKRSLEAGDIAGINKLY